VTLIPKWRRLSFGCGPLFPERLNCAWVGAGFGSAEEIPGRRAFSLGRRVAPTFEKTSRLPGTLGLPSQPARREAQFAVVRLPPPTGTTVARRPSPAPPATAPHEALAAHTPPHSIFSRATRLGSHDTSRRRWRRSRESPKADSFFETRRPAPGREKCSATRISTRLRGQHRGRLRQHPSAATAQ
jgi:hypothetical protein